jgi:limonene-1,2-epoxide hydrolase
MSNEQLIRQFISDWSSLDAQLLASYFAEDGSYHNMPMQPIVGRDKIRDFIENFIANWTSTDWEVINIVESGNTVLCERIDRTRSPQGDVDLPCVGVFEIKSGKIQVWRDYFDLGTYMKAFQG